jgi:hypothetical protein
MMAAVDMLTIAQSWHGRPQTKLIGRDRAGNTVRRGFSKEKLYTFSQIPVLGIEDLATALERLSADRTICIVRGTPIQGIPVPARRLAHSDPDTGDPATLAPTPRRVLAIDMDGIDQGLAEDPAVDPEDAIEHLIGLLPDDFTEASCWWQFSSSQGSKPGRLSARLWFILDRPITDEDLRRWANAVNRAAGRKLVDPALYNPAQPHYIAAPVLEGIDDPLPRRSGFRRGLSDEVEIIIPEPAQVAAGVEGLGLKPARGFESYLAAIGGGHGFNNAIFRAICSCVGNHGVDGIDPIALRERLREAILAAPPGDRSRAEIERYASARYLDDEIRRVLARKAAEQPHVEGAEGPEPHYQAEEAAPAEAANRLRTLLGRVIWQALEWTEAAGGPPQTGIKTPAGLGKTTAVLDILAASSTLPGLDPGRQPEVWFFVPTVTLALEAAAKARERGLEVQLIRGREAVIGGEPLCRKHEEAAIVARAGLPVMEALCRKKLKDRTEMRCQFHDACRYLQQFDATGPALRIFVHEYMFLPTPKGLPKPHLIVVDEAFALRSARRASFGIDRLTTPRTGMKIEHEAEIHDIACKVREALEKGADPRAVADADTFSRILERESTVDGEQFVWPSMLWAEQKRRLATLRKNERLKLCALWRLLRDQAGRSGPLQQIELRRSEPMPGGEAQDRVHVWWHAPPRLPQAPVILLDASLDERLARKLLPRIKVETIAARRNAEVIQVSDTACSRNRLLSFEGASESEQARAANRLRDVRHLAEVEAAGGRRALLVTYKAAEERLGSIPSVDITHFGALRGLDRYKDHDTIIVAGREQPPPAVVEDLARSLFGDDEEPLSLSGGFITEVRGYRLRDGTRHGVQVAVHADPRCQAILEQICERETEQAIDRLRLIHRKEPARVILLSNVVVDATVDRLVTWRELIPNRLTVAAARLGGVLPLAPAWLAARYPNLWASEEAARQEVKRSELRGQTPNKILYLGDDPLTPAIYRLKGQRGPRPSRALIVEGHPSPEAALAALVGPLAMFRWTATTEAEAEEPAASGPEAAPLDEPVAPPGPETQVPDQEPETDPPPPPAGCARCSDPVDGGTLCQVCAWLARPPARLPPRPSITPSWEDDRAWLRLIGKAESREKRIEVVTAWTAAAGGTLWRQGNEATLALPATLRRGLARAELLTQARILLLDRVQIEERQPGHIPFALPIARTPTGLRREALP